MRIIAGKYRRRKLRSAPGLHTRPITDLAREILFERLGEDLAGKRIADVFAGTGTMGLEALSRGAAGVVFIENDKKAFELLQENVRAVGAQDQSLCWRTDATRTSFRPKGVPHLLPYETVFFDPPYRMLKDLQPGRPLFRSLERLAREDVSAEGALLVIRSPGNAEFVCPDGWKPQQFIDLRTMEARLFEKRSNLAE